MNDKLEGIVLKQSDYKENDVLLSVLLKEEGRISLVAKGVLKSASKNNLICQPFTMNRFQFDFVETKSIFQVHTGEVIHSFYHIKEDLNAINAATLMCEIIEKCTQQNEVVENLYNELAFCLEMLHNKKPIHLVVCYFVARILEEMGFDPVVDECVLCGEQSVSGITLAEGGFVCKECATQVTVVPVTLNNLKNFRYINKAHQENFEILSTLIKTELSDVKIFIDFLCLHSGLKLDSLKFYEECSS